MTNEREITTITYFERAKKKIIGPISGLDKQFFADILRNLWSSFDAFLALKFPAITNRQMQKNYATTYQNDFVKWVKSDKYRDCINKIVKLVPVNDMRPRNPSNDAILNNPENLDELLYLLYRIRSNLDHGAKDLESQEEFAQRNRNLVKCAVFITFEILEKTLINEKIIST